MRNAALACIDWGTSSFRLWLLSEDGAVLAETRNHLGAGKLQPSEHEAVLEAALSETGEVGAADNLPALICGMAGARHGWREAEYLHLTIDSPVDLTQLPAHAIAAPARRQVRILPGIARIADPGGRADVMRGEETQLLGAVLRGKTDGAVCLPGTHSKWALLRDGALADFQTAMTGEVFALLKTHSVLAPFVAADGEATADSPAFAAAVQETFAAPQNLLASLFSVRAAALLADVNPADCAARLSGLLIGAELAAARSFIGGNRVTLISAGALAGTYTRALQCVGLQCELLDAGEVARAGLHYAAGILWSTS